jgi:hypothetical protein
VVRQRVADGEDPVLGLPQAQVALGVAGCGDDFPFGVAQVQGVVVAEGLVDGVGGDGLVEVLRDAASRVAAVDGLAVREAAGRCQRQRTASGRCRLRGRSASGC